MDVTGLVPLLALLTPVLGAAGVVLLRHRTPARELCGVVAGIVQLGLVATMVPAVRDGGTVSVTLSTFVPEVSIALRADALGVVLAGTAAVLWVLTTFYSMGYFGLLCHPWVPERALIRHTPFPAYGSCCQRLESRVRGTACVQQGYGLGFSGWSRSWWRASSSTRSSRPWWSRCGHARPPSVAAGGAASAAPAMTRGRAGGGGGPWTSGWAASAHPFPAAQPPEPPTDESQEGYFGTAPEPALTRFHACLCLTMAATIGVAFSANLITLFLFYEVLTVITYPLVTHTGTPEAIRGGRRYLAYQLGAAIAFLLPAIALTYIEAGTFDFVPGGIFGPGASSVLLVIVYVLYLLGIAKAALMPIHSWLPAAMVAPVPVSALLHAVAVVNVGVFCVIRVVLDVFGSDLTGELGLGVLTVAATSVTILIASLYALRLDNLKGILAYSTIGQLSYMMLGVALLSPGGRTGGILHLVGHSFSKITLFFAVGSIYLATHRTLASELRGIGRQLPWTMAAFAVGALSIIGLPPTVGFVAKYFLFLGAIEAGQWAALVVLSVSTLLSAGYYLRILHSALFAAPPTVPAGGSGDTARFLRAPTVTEPRALVVGPMLVTASVTLLLGVAPGWLLDLIRVTSG